MNVGEYEVMSRVEEHHWWYRGLRDTLARVLTRSDMPLPDAPRILDAGCGTGKTLGFLQELLRPAYLAGFDASEAALDFARRKAPAADIYQSDITEPEIRTDGLDIIVSLDVINIPGVERSFDGLRELVARLRPGGRLILNLPAYDWLYSEHDVAVHTTERFTLRRVRDLIDELGLSVERLSYRLCFLFPIVAAARLPTMLRSRTRGRADAARSDLHRLPGRLSQTVLLSVLRAENALIAAGVRLPWGSSVFVVGGKR